MDLKGWNKLSPATRDLLAVLATVLAALLGLGCYLWAKMSQGGD